MKIYQQIFGIVEKLSYLWYIKVEGILQLTLKTQIKHG
jgi:hypothetical protein